mmetsp:Transcript_56168/g.90933  ORF Transcript_56168/g.90933 Transcript_56168/m.90933 type:complete len:85 (-) Transcript_56168:298-552(-)
MGDPRVRVVDEQAALKITQVAFVLLDLEDSCVDERGQRTFFHAWPAPKVICAVKAPDVGAAAAQILGLLLQGQGTDDGIEGCVR